MFVPRHAPTDAHSLVASLTLRHLINNGPATTGLNQVFPDCCSQ
jgi:hypothetical protein